MTNEEYRTHVHEMYMNNFVHQGKTPKALQIFGDSFGHFSDENAWPGVLAKKLNIPVFNFCWSGGSLEFTLDQFLKNYDEDCLNIFLITSLSRMTAKSYGQNVTEASYDIFVCGSGETGEQKIMYLDKALLLPDTIKKEYQQAADGYFKYFDNNQLSENIWGMVLKQIFLNYNNVVFLNCFTPSHWQGTLTPFLGDILECPLYVLQRAKFLNGPRPDSLSGLNRRDNSYNKVEEEKWSRMKNHLSSKMNRLIGEQLYEILVNNEKFFITYDDCCDLDENDILFRPGSRIDPLKEENKLRKEVSDIYNKPAIKLLLPMDYR